MTLDARAARATRSLRASVSGVAPVSIPVIVNRQRRSMLTSFAMAAVAVLFIVGVASAMPSLFEPDQVATDTSVPDGTPIVVVPDEGDDGRVVDLEVLGIRMTRSSSDSPEPYTVFYGTGEPGSTVTVVSEYAEATGAVGEDGRFELKVWFVPRPPAGVPFPISVIVDGQEYVFEFTSLYDPDNIGITAHQTHGSSSAESAYEKFFGTAPPGTEIVATSPFGSADTVADEHGRWNLKVWFEELPFDEPFEITLTVGGETFTFLFVSGFEPAELPITVKQVNSVSDSPNPYVQFIGTAPPGTHLLARSGYGVNDLVVGESGEFSLKVWFSPLPPAGQQFPITFEVNQEYYGTYAFKSLYVSAPATDGVEVDQYNTESWDANPWAKFHVYGPAGTQVEILSPYGSTSATLASSGDYVKLFFSTLPPAGEQFQLTVKIDGETFGTYPFTSWFDPNVIEVSQYNTESWDANPWVKFHVYGPSGTQVEILSPYGSTSATLASSGDYVKLHFSTLPPSGESFTVTVKIDGETFGTYPFTSHWDPANVDITANSKWGTCSEDPPYDKYFGTAPPGTEVSITSDYGTATTTADANGQWSKVLYFTGAPLDTEFTVTVTIDGEVFTFGMIVTG